MNQAEREREAHRRVNGEFGNHDRTAPGQTLGAGVSLGEWVPADIDAVLAEKYAQLDRAKARHSSAVWRTESKYTYNAKEAQKQVGEWEDKIAEIEQDIAPYEQEFARRGGWTRAFITRGAAPHVHKSMGCSTCNRDGKATPFGWLTEYSGASEAEIIEDAGERACTVCYPDAPVGTLSRPTKMFSEDERQKQAEREERERKKVERDRLRAEKAPTADGSELRVRVSAKRERYETFKTETAARQWATNALNTEMVYATIRANNGGGPPSEESEAVYAAVREVAASIAEKHGQHPDYVWEELDVKWRVRAKRMTAKEARERLDAKRAELQPRTS